MLEELAHQIGLLPFVVVLVWWWRAPARYWLLAFAWSVSWIGDSIGYALGNSPVGTYFWLPVQIAVVLLAVGQRWHIVVLFVLTLALASFSLSAPGPDWLLTVAGSLWIMHAAEGEFVGPLWVYFGVGSLAYMLMITADLEAAKAFWSIYQALRLTAFAWFGVLVVRGKRRLT